MKKFCLVWWMALAVVACRDDEKLSPEKGEVTFSFSPVAEPGGRLARLDLPDGAVLRISISNTVPEVIYTLKEVALLKIGDGYFSEPLALTRGDYGIMDFLIVDPATNHVLYATPKIYTPLAPLVSQPLPIPFTVLENQTVNTVVEVLDPGTHPPEHFGYASFGLDIVPSQGFSVAVFKPVASGFETTDAQAYILHGSDTLVRKTVMSNTPLYWNAEPGEEYQVVVLKHGYGLYQKTFTLASITAELNHQPLSVVLQPAFTWLAGVQNVGFGIEAKDGATLIYNWGDNSPQDTVHFPLEPGTGTRHEYAGYKKYFVSITGDVEDITMMSMRPRDGAAQIDTLSMTALTGLTWFTSSFNDYFGSSVDLSGNVNLEILSLAFHPALKSLDVTHNPRLRIVSIVNSGLSPAEVDKFLAGLLATVEANNTHNGRIDIYKTSYPYIIGPPTEAGLASLETLLGEYGWTFVRW